MKKNELVHLHALLARVADEYVARGDATPADFASYDRLQISPLALRAPRDDHEAAVETLAALLAERADAALDRGQHTGKIPPS